MPQFFYAYHSPENKTAFDPSGGYGVSSESKRNNIKVGDLVFVIQKFSDRDPFELCGLYEVTGHYNGESRKNQYRIRLAETRLNQKRITINEEELSQKLPQLTGTKSWTNFKRHFCRQGASLQHPLQADVVRALTEVLHDSIHTEEQDPISVNAFEKEFEEAVRKSKKLTSEQRRLRLSQASKTPETKLMLVKTFVRNPDVVAEALHLAGGFCGRCGNGAPFVRRSDGSKYLEGHHKVPLSQGGEDTIENAIALCPNCHREMHYGV